jgi:S-adenosylmethionine:tRNA-ribosyltransferase-isomerase (queuine synthetase)
MDHVAIMKKSWRLIDKILAKEKTIESRWYLSRRCPWNIVKKGDVVYFKNSGEAIIAKAEVKRVVQFENLTPKDVKDILDEYGGAIGIPKESKREFFNRFSQKTYCILVFLKNPQRIAPFHINKKGFGNMASWIAVNDIHEIQQTRQG